MGIKLFQFNDSNLIIAVIGISFYSLQNISFLHSVYWQKSAVRFIDYVFYISFLPKFISGPIESYNNISSSLKQPDFNDFSNGVGRICLGLIKKYVLSERLAYSLLLYGKHNGDLPGATELISSIMYTLQLYFDFSAYIDIVIGASLLVGVKLTENFNLPFRSLSITDFWHRWHISLMNWLRNYIYYPLAFRFRTKPNMAIILCVLLLFTFSALWHGIELTFIVWGSIHAMVIIIETYKQKVYKTTNRFFNKVMKLPAILYVFSVVVFANIFFNAKSISEAILKIQKIIHPQFLINEYVSQLILPFQGGGMPYDVFNFKITALLVLFFILFEKVIQKLFLRRKYIFLISLTSIIIILVFGRLTDTQSFIYAQF
jgi:D-alanyl-lipoteichoic acid acyltransferase DltB (MBOAT superfamily)